MGGGRAFSCLVFFLSVDIPRAGLCQLCFLCYVSRCIYGTLGLARALFLDALWNTFFFGKVVDALSLLCFRVFYFLLLGSVDMRV